MAGTKKIHGAVFEDYTRSGSQQPKKKKRKKKKKKKST
jgi:hypothetical protein